MSDQVYSLKLGEVIPVEPVGSGLESGWLPGTWVKYSTTALTFSGAMATVEISDGTGSLAGFLKTGPQHKQTMQGLSDMWNYQLQRENGDSRADLTSSDAGMGFEFDENQQIQNIGTRVVSMNTPPSGFHKFYTFEVNNLAERTVSGSGAALTYTPGDSLYVSSQGLLTSEQESGSHPWTGYTVARYDSDFEGDYIIAAPTM